MCPASSTMRKNGSSARKSFRWPTEFIPLHAHGPGRRGPPRELGEACGSAPVNGLDIVVWSLAAAGCDGLREQQEHLAVLSRHAGCDCAVDPCASVDVDVSDRLRTTLREKPKDAVLEVTWLR
jgi:hypothetical protein